MVRLATVNDAEQLDILNNAFNGKGETALENIKNSLLNNQQEVVIVDDENGLLTGFVCVQLKNHFAMMNICQKSQRYMLSRNIEKEVLQWR